MSETAAVLSSLAQLKTVRLNREKVWVPEWDIWVWLYELTGEQLEGWRNSFLRRSRSRGESTVQVDPKLLRMQTARLLCLAIRDENGQRILADTDAAEILKLGAAGVQRLATVASRLSRIGVNEDEVDEEEKDSGPTPSDSFSSDSRDTSAELEASS